MNTANIIVFRGVSSLYSYTIPSVLDSSIVPGTHVMIPFGKATVQGLVFNISKHDATHTLKPILDVSSKLVQVSDSLLHLISWFSHYYQCHPYKSYQTIIGSKKQRKLPVLDKHDRPLSSAHSLTDEQSTVLKKLTQSSQREFYLKGVTGSGKTEVYLQLARHVIDQEKSVILLVPEISLTPQLMRHFSDRFGNIVTILHSGQTKKEKEISYNRLLKGEAKIAIGPRSAVFSPIQDLGLIIIDEEHDSSYKQDTHPRYDARVVAKERCRHHHAMLLFGSATPSLDTFSSFLNPDSESEVLEMHERFNKQVLPKLHIVDIKEEYREGLPVLISKHLDRAIQNRLEKKEKVMILVNRRGYSTQIVCQKCNKPYDCEQCGLSFTYHMDKCFRCHRCHVVRPVRFTCKSCGSYKLRFTGTGIQKVEIELKQLFPTASILRMDKDTVANVSELDAMFDTFKKEGDILLGTQLISKGHHIEEVTLVGVIGIDTSLNLPDFRSPELSFQLLTQVSGRPGRGKIPGEVIVQTYQPQHYAIEHAKSHDYMSFYRQEMSYREQLYYPPFSSLINLILSSTDHHSIKRYNDVLAPFLKELEKQAPVQIIGPQPCPLEKVRNHFRWHVLLKCPHDSVSLIKKELLTIPKHGSSLRVITDFDPAFVL